MRRFLVGLAALTAVTTGLAFAADVGPKADVAAVRATEHKLYPRYITYAVRVVGDYALLGWDCCKVASGQDVFKRISGERWNRIAHGGGAMALNDLVHLGVPASVASQLCSKKSPFFCPP